jgi:hypothetical protein
VILWGDVMSASDLKLSYKLDRQDYWSGQMQILQQGPWRVVTIALGLWMVSALAASVWVMQTGPKGTVLELGIAALYGLMGLALMVAVIARGFGRFKLNRALAHAEGGPLAPTTIDISGTGIAWDDGASQTQFSWGAFDRVEVTDRLVLFYSSPVQAIMIPRRVLGDEEAMLAFVASARDNIRSARR